MKNVIKSFQLLLVQTTLSNQIPSTRRDIKISNFTFKTIFSTYFFIYSTDTRSFHLRIFETFSLSVWICLAFSIIVTGLSLKHLLELKNNDLSYVHTFLISFGVYCQQGYQGHTNSVSARCLVIFLYLSGILTYNFYTSVLVSIIVDSKFETNLKNGNDIAKSNIHLLFRNTSFINYWLKVNIVNSKYYFLFSV